MPKIIVNGGTTLNGEVTISGAKNAVLPTPATKISTLPSVSSHISGPVVTLCAAGFAGFSN